MNCKCPKCGNRFDLPAPAVQVERAPEATSVHPFTIRIHYPGREVTEVVNYTKATVEELTTPVPGYAPVVAFNEDGSTRGPLMPQGEFYVPAPFSPVEEEQKQRLREKEINK